MFSFEQNSLLNKLIDNLPLGVIVTDAHGECLVVSRRMRELWCKGDFNKPVELFRDADIGLLHLDDTPYTPQEWPLFKVLQTRKPVQTELVKIKSGGDVIFAEITASPFTENGQLSYVFIVCEDVTEKIRAQEQEWLTRVQTDFLARMSHEIRTPMHGILGMLDLLGDTNLSLDQTASVDVIRRSTKRLLVILNDILDFAKLDAGKLALDFHYFNVRRLFNDIQTVHSAAADNHVSVKIVIDEALPEELYCDSHRLAQCMNNLLSNAIKFTSRNMYGAYVRVEVTKQQVKSKELLVIAVKDTGIGMDKQTLEKLFCPFTQANSNITRTYGGTGLGLVITKELITQLGGEMTVESELGKGSTFTILLPIITPSAPTNKRPFHRRDSSEDCNNGKECKKRKSEGKMRVLLAEDNLINQKLGIALLQKKGFSVTAVDNGQLALDLLEKDPEHDILLLDIQMPVLGGHETCRILRQRGWKKPIIALTAESDKKTCLAVGMNDYVQKPFAIEELEEKILSLCSSY